MSGMRLGVFVSLHERPQESIDMVRRLGFPTCRIGCWRLALMTREAAHALRQAADAAAIEITTIWVGTPGSHVWNFIDGPRTIGLVPEQTRAERLAALKHGADFASWVGVPPITTHVGFIPENADDGAKALRPSVRPMWRTPRRSGQRR